jgi:hypothetical protein
MQRRILLPRYKIVMVTSSRTMDSQTDPDLALVRVTAVGGARSTNGGEEECV